MKIITTLLILTTIFFSYTLAQEQSGNLEFIENQGQLLDVEGNLRPDVLYIGDVQGANIYLRRGEVSYVMTKTEGLEEIEELEEEIEHEKDEIEKNKKQEKLAALEAKAVMKAHRVDMVFVNANVNASVRGEDAGPGYSNYYLGHCSQGITGIKAYRTIVYEQLYSNIDVRFYGGKEKDF